MTIVWSTTIKPEQTQPNVTVMAQCGWDLSGVLCIVIPNKHSDGIRYVLSRHRVAQISRGPHSMPVDLSWRCWGGVVTGVRIHLGVLTETWYIAPQGVLIPLSQIRFHVHRVGDTVLVIIHKPTIAPQVLHFRLYKYRCRFLLLFLLVLFCSFHIKDDGAKEDQEHQQLGKGTISNDNIQEPTEISKQPIRTRYLGHVTGYQSIRDQYFLIRSVPVRPSRL
eukprot:sb/3469781/